MRAAERVAELLVSLSCVAVVIGCSGGVSNDESSTFASLSVGPEDGGSGESSDTEGGTQGFCGDQVCDLLTESCQDCQADCGVCPFCGDGTCNGAETCMLCALDCEVCPGCGDGVCEGQETCADCPQDCTEGCGAAVCGDGVCNGNETCSNCQMDCGMCAPSCGDGSCNGAEHCGNCEQDCGACVDCPNGECGVDESCISCAQDCGACTCPCSDDPDFDNFCFYGPGTGGCPMTMPGGYCDPNGDGSYDDGDWNMGYFDYLAQCG